MASIELVQIDPQRNRNREYRLHAATTLFGELALVIEWGRRGGRLRTKVEILSDAAALTRRFWELLERRRRHGYSPVVSARPAGHGPGAAQAGAADGELTSPTL